MADAPPAGPGLSEEVGGLFVKTLPLWIFLIVVGLAYMARFFFLNTLAIWVFLALVYALYWSRWHYVKRKNVHETPRVLFEIVIPKEITKSPLAMETVFSTLNQTYEGNWFLRITKGTFRTWFTFEMVSFEGDVHFYVFLDDLQKQHFRAQMYAQYPEILLREVDDYTHRTPKPWQGEWDMFGVEMKLAKPDPYPIKTYVDYGLDKPGLKEEEKIDPMSSTIEYLSNLGKGEYCYVQIHIMATKKRKRLWFFDQSGKWIGMPFTKTIGWQEEGEALIASMNDKNSVGADGKPVFKFRTPGEDELLKALDRNISKIGFDTGMRMLYIAKKDVFNKPSQHGMTRIWDQYASQAMNGFGLGEYTGFDYPWQDPTGKSTLFKKRIMFQNYQLRSFFYPPYRKTFGFHVSPSKVMVLNQEELATIFHIPGGVVTSSGLARIESKKAEAPVNLPGE